VGGRLESGQSGHGGICLVDWARLGVCRSSLDPGAGLDRCCNSSSAISLLATHTHTQDGSAEQVRSEGTPAANCLQVRGKEGAIDKSRLAKGGQAASKRATSRGPNENATIGKGHEQLDRGRFGILRPNARANGASELTAKAATISRTIFWSMDILPRRCARLKQSSLILCRCLNHEFERSPPRRTNRAVHE
jgi:hypothetical protein